MRRTCFALLALFAAPFAMSCGPRAPGRSVLLVTLDTTRADHLGAYGRPDARTPEFDRIARRGVLFQDAIVDVPVTLPSHTTILTGIPALGHGVRYNADFKVGEEAATLAESLHDLGYRTAAVVSSLILDSEFGLDQGFETYDDDLPPGYVMFDRTKYPTTHWLPKAERRANDVVAPAIGWLRKEARAPWFLWAHLYDAHFPYDPPPPWERTSASDYLAEIQFADREMGRLVRAIERRREREEPVIVVTADHGEGLDQHREENHGIFIYDDTIRVPLVVQAAGAVLEGSIVSEMARSIDVPPTVLEAAGHAGRALGIGGSLVALANARAAPPDTAAYAESMKTKLFYSGSGLKAVRTRHAKYILAPRPELYDLVHDPGETENLLDGRADADAGEPLHDELVRRVRAILARDLAAVEAAQPNEEMMEGIRSLGYVTGSDGKTRPGSAETELALEGFDPKDLVDVSMGGREVQNGFYDRGEMKLRRFFATATPPSAEPRMARLWAAAHHNYAKIWMARANYAEAAREYARAVESDPDYMESAWSRVYALNLDRDFSAAERVSSEYLARHPESWKIRLHRAFSLAFLGRGIDAQEELQRIMIGAPAAHEARKAAEVFLQSLGTPREGRALESYLESAARTFAEAPPEEHAVD
jgi:arylsulfatase A-like enzyme